MRANSIWVFAKYIDGLSACLPFPSLFLYPLSLCVSMGAYARMCAWICMPKAKRGEGVILCHLSPVSLRQALCELNPCDLPSCPAGATGCYRNAGI